MLLDISIASYRAQHGGYAAIEDKNSRRRRADCETVDSDAPERRLAVFREYLAEAERLGKPERVKQIRDAMRRIGLPTPKLRMEPGSKASQQFGAVYRVHVGGGYFHVIEGHVVAELLTREQAESFVAGHRAT